MMLLAQVKEAGDVGKEAIAKAAETGNLVAALVILCIAGLAAMFIYFIYLPREKAKRQRDDLLFKHEIESKKLYNEVIAGVAESSTATNARTIKMHAQLDQILKAKEVEILAFEEIDAKVDQVNLGQVVGALKGIMKEKG